MSVPAPRTKTILTQMRELAVDRSSSPMKLMLGGVLGVVLLATFFMSGTFTAITFIDNAAIDVEKQRAVLALDQVLGDEAAAPDATTAYRIATEYLLARARIAAAGQLAADEVSVPIAGGPSMLAWTPRRFASEAFESVAPMRLALAAMVIALIAFILLRLHGVARDLEARRVLAHELASRDALTGLKNRLTFDQELREAFAAGIHPGKPLALLYLDLDAFKSVNDTLGHMAGDQLLRMAGERLTATVEPSDTVARLGGDEFAILRHAAASHEELAILAVRVRTALSAPFPLDGKLATIGVSIGIAIAPETATTAEALVRAADVALYRAKAMGQPHYAFANAVQGMTGSRRRAAA